MLWLKEVLVNFEEISLRCFRESFEPLQHCYKEWKKITFRLLTAKSIQVAFSAIHVIQCKF